MHIADITSLESLDLAITAAVRDLATTADQLADAALVDRLAELLQILEHAEYEASHELRRAGERIDALVRLRTTLYTQLRTSLQAGNATRANVRWRGERHTLQLRRNPPAVLIEHAEQLPADLCTQQRVPDKRRMRALLERGEAVPGARLVQRWRVEVR